MIYYIVIAASWLLVTIVNATNYYVLVDSIVGNDFYDAFTFENIRDPTNGRVEYVNEATARNLNLTWADRDTFILRADHTSVLKANSPGRKSVRIRSKATYTTHVAVFDVRHMPQGCSTWPAVWETKEATWPYGGEVDIIEGVNSQPPNSVTLHTGPGCKMPYDRDETGTPTYLDCDAFVDGNEGCGVRLSTPESFGPLFNDNGGGWYAIERTLTEIRVWFWARDDSSVPLEVRDGYTLVNPDIWGTPSASFPDTYCDIEEHFSENNIIINLTFCGDWAGDVYEESGCPSTCVDFVNNNPEAFMEAYFDFASVNVYLN